MKSILVKASVGAGALVVFSGAFVGFAALNGKPLHRLPVFGTLFETPPEGEGDLQLVDDGTGLERPAPKTNDELMRANMGVLSTFLMPSPYDARELEQLEARLEDGLEEIGERLVRIDGRERELLEWERSLEERFNELEDLRNRLEAWELELAQRSEEVDRDVRVAEERERQSWTELATFFEQDDVKKLAPKLLQFTPEEAARILRALDTERASELVNSLPPDRYREYLDAYRSTPPAEQ